MKNGISYRALCNRRIKEKGYELYYWESDRKNGGKIWEEK